MFIVGFAVLLSGCRGTAPARSADPASGWSAVLLRGRLILPSGEIRDGGLSINLESNEAAYRLGAAPRETIFYAVKPGTYRVSPTRAVFGIVQAKLTVYFNDHTYKVPFPDELLHHGEIVVKPGEIVSLGILEARLARPSPDVPTEISVALIDDPDTRRELVQQMIQKIMDPKISPDARDNLVGWSMALEQALVNIQGSPNAATAIEPSSP